VGARALALGLVLALAAGAAAARPRAPAAPSVAGPRSTSATTPVYRFKAARAVAFRCAFDSPRLHRCAARFSQRLRVGSHVLRVQAVGRAGRTSRVVVVRVTIAPPTPEVPTLPLAATVAVGRGAGAPAVGAGAVWVPNTDEGTLSRVDATTNAVVTTIRYAPARPAGETGEFYDSAAFGHGSVWVASDQRGRVARVDPATNQVTATIPVAQRPAEITVTSDAVWVAHFLQSVATRIDPVTNAKAETQLTGAPLTGAAGDGSTIWLLVNQPQTLIHLGSDGHELAHADVTPNVSVKRGFLSAWWLAAGEGGVWATHPNQDVVTRTDPVSTAVTATVAVSPGRLFGVAAGSGAVWAVTDEALVRIDPATNRAVAKALFTRATPIGFTGVAVGGGAVWATNYDRAELYRVNP
jgi:virginiamycin B lyase